MPRRTVEFVQGEYYHIYNRGCNRGLTFRTPENYRYFTRLMQSALPRDHLAIIAYCLMPNHFHFLLRQEEETSVSDFMFDLCNPYVKAFNRRNDRTGTLFEGPFKAKHVNSEGHLLHLCRYIHRNPLDAGLVYSPDEWEFSNYLEWIGRRNSALIDKSFQKEHFENIQEYEDFVLMYVPPPKLADELKPYLID